MGVCGRMGGRERNGDYCTFIIHNSPLCGGFIVVEDNVVMIVSKGDAQTGRHAKISGG